jgi:hypothetical protein
MKGSREILNQFEFVSFTFMFQGNLLPGILIKYTEPLKLKFRISMIPFPNSPVYQVKFQVPD